jgi:CPA2 family monovalent cation:H+ antiporter-2
MEAAHAFLQNLALVLCVAAVTTVLFQRLRQPVVFGYLLAGMIVGPHIPIPLVADEEMIHTLSELGVILLLFSLGLEFSLRKPGVAGIGRSPSAVTATRGERRDDTAPASRRTVDLRIAGLRDIARNAG